MDAKQFILNTLLPYKEDKSKCATKNTKQRKNLCVYLTKDGKKCAVGQHLKEGGHQTVEGDVFVLNNRHGLSNILTNEAKEMNFDIWTWRSMQLYHDSLATDNIDNANGAITQLEKTLDIELKELYIT